MDASGQVGRLPSPLHMRALKGGGVSCINSALTAVWSGDRPSLTEGAPPPRVRNISEPKKKKGKKLSPMSGHHHRAYIDLLLFNCVSHTQGEVEMILLIIFVFENRDIPLPVYLMV